MNTNDIGKIIKKIRTDNNMTQEEFANKYFVTFQAVSKWENGKSIPDISLLKQISKDYNLKLSKLLDGEYEENDKPSNKKNKKKILIAILIILLSLFLFIIISNSTNNNFSFSSISSSCSNFEVTGTIAYNKNKSAIHISNIDYCGKDKDKLYKEITCSLYENNGKDKVIIRKSDINKKNITLEDYLKKVEFEIEDYSHVCNNYNSNDLFIIIETRDLNNKKSDFNVKIKVNKKCKVVK